MRGHRGTRFCTEIGVHGILIISLARSFFTYFVQKAFESRHGTVDSFCGDNSFVRRGWRVGILCLLLGQVSTFLYELVYILTTE